MRRRFSLNNSRNGKHGFALVITLIMLVLAAVIVVSLLTSASLERTTSKSVSDRYQAELAVQNGLEAAKKALIASPSAANSLTANDTFLVVRVDGPAVPVSPALPATTAAYYYLARPQAGAVNKIDYYPLFAGGSPITGLPINLAPGAPQPVVTRPNPPANPDPASPGGAAIDTDTGKTKIVKAYPLVSSWLGAPSTQWIEVRDPNDTAVAPNHNLPYQRYTFWIEDLAGYLDASVAGNTADTGNANKRPLDQSLPAKRYGSTPAEIALFTIFDPPLQTDSGNTGAKGLILDRALQFTVPTLKLISSGAGNTDVTSPYLAVRFQADSELPLVPYGYGYVDEGDLSKPKVDINAKVTTGGAAAVQAIATKINDNLPTFGSQRKGGLTGLDYVNTIAASMIDYADADSDATVGADYRGYDSYPLVNEIYSMKWWKQTYSKNGTYWVTISMDTWIELWNPCNQSISGNASIDILENLPVQVGAYTYTFGTKPADLTNGATVATTYPAGGPPLSITMQPNEYTTYHLRSDVFEYDSGVPTTLIFPPTSSSKLPLTASLLSNYETTWKGSAAGSAAVVDKAGGGIERLSGNLAGPPNYINSNKRWSGSYAGFSYADPNSFNTFDNPGDPRSAFYLGRATATTPAAAQSVVAYAQGSSFWVRNNRSNIASTAIYAAVKPSSWPDRGHDTALVVTAPPTAPVAQAVADPPTTRPAAAITEPTKAPATISNAGAYSTTAEFGNVFDPAQWNITPDANNRWTDIINSSTADSNYGGGLSLRIGRPEFTRFNQPGIRAWQLLDLFNPGNRVGTRGLVNINTASRDALRALGANVFLNRDPDVQDTTDPNNSVSLKNKLYPPFLSKQADLFANAVIAERPFLSSAQLASLTISGSATPFFGNATAWANTTQPAQPTEWNDSGAEEYFAKVFPLASVRSRNFRVFVTGQNLDKGGNALSTVSKVFQVYLNPTRDASGKITAQETLVTYEAQSSL